MVENPVQKPDVVSVTGSPEEAVALTWKSGSPTCLFGSGPNEIVWLAFCAVVVSVTCGAALKFALPAWS